MPYFQGGHILATPESEAYARQQDNLRAARQEYQRVAPSIGELVHSGDYASAARALADERAQLGSLYGPEVANNVTQPGFQLVGYGHYLDAVQQQQQQGGQPDLGQAMQAQAMYDPSAIGAGMVPLSKVLLNQARTGQAQATTGLRGAQQQSEEQLRGPKAQWLTGQAGLLPQKGELIGAQTNLANQKAANVGTAGNANQRAASAQYGRDFNETQQLMLKAQSPLGPTFGDTQSATIASQIQAQVQKLNESARAAGGTQWQVNQVDGKPVLLPVQGGGAQAQPVNQADEQASAQAGQQAQAPGGLIPPPNLGSPAGGTSGVNPYQQPPAAPAPTQGAPPAAPQMGQPAAAQAQQGPQAVGNLMNLIPPDVLQQLRQGVPVNGSDILARLQQQGVPPAQAIGAIRAAMAQFSGAAGNAGGQ
jgi:hypothetical protein